MSFPLVKTRSPLLLADLKKNPKKAKKKKRKHLRVWLLKKRLAVRRRRMANDAPHTNSKPRAVASWLNKLLHLHVTDRRFILLPSEFCFSFTNVLRGLFTRRIPGINPQDLGNVPSDVSRCPETAEHRQKKHHCMLILVFFLHTHTNTHLVRCRVFLAAGKANVGLAENKPRPTRSLCWRSPSASRTVRLMFVFWRQQWGSI